MNDWLEYKAAFEQNDLAHHGVLGMKWGVRKDRQLMAERRYNKKKDQLKNEYETGGMSKNDYKSERKKAKKAMKADIKQAKKDVKGLSKEELTKKFQETRKQAIKEIPKYRLQSGLYSASRVLRGWGTGSLLANIALNSAVVGALLGGPAGLAVGAAMAAFGGATTVGISRVGKRIDNKIRRQINR